MSTQKQEMITLTSGHFRFKYQIWSSWSACVPEVRGQRYLCQSGARRGEHSVLLHSSFWCWFSSSVHTPLCLCGKGGPSECSLGARGKYFSSCSWCVSVLSPLQNKNKTKQIHFFQVAVSYKDYNSPLQHTFHTVQLESSQGEIHHIQCTRAAYRL